MAAADAAVAAPWRRITGWLLRHAPGWFERDGPRPLMNPPAAPTALDALQAHLGVELPAPLRALLNLHDGCRGGDYPLPMRATDPTRWRTLPAAEVAQVWDLLQAIAAAQAYAHDVRTDGRVLAVWWSPAWIPLADCGMGDVVCIDTRPAPGGDAGQLIIYAHDHAERKRLYPTLADWLRECAADLEGGRYEHIEGVGLCARGAALPGPGAGA